jgi:hypothetical protein
VPTREDMSSRSRLPSPTNLGVGFCSANLLAGINIGANPAWVGGQRWPSKYDQIVRFPRAEIARAADKRVKVRVMLDLDRITCIARRALSGSEERPLPDPRALPMTTARVFRGLRFPANVILWAVRWSLQFPISYRHLERMLADRGVEVATPPCPAGSGASSATPLGARPPATRGWSSLARSTATRARCGT